MKMDSERSRLHGKIAGALLRVNSDQKFSDLLMQESNIVLLCFGDVQIHCHIGVHTAAVPGLQHGSLGQRTSFCETEDRERRVLVDLLFEPLNQVVDLPKEFLPLAGIEFQNLTYEYTQIRISQLHCPTSESPRTRNVRAVTDYLQDNTAWIPQLVGANERINAIYGMAGQINGRPPRSDLSCAPPRPRYGIARFAGCIDTQPQDF